VSNCHVRIAFAPNQFETAELLSKMTGITTVAKASYNFSGSRLSPVMNHMNASVDHIERPLMTPDEVLRIKPPKKEGEGSAEKIVAPGHMVIFVSGYHPILGTQILYFSDPVLALRAQIEPPKKFWSIGDKGVIVPQVAVDRTANVVSEAETVAPTESKDAAVAAPVPESPRMQAFIEEMSTGENHADE
jgi:type IV secretory pathway TraG/TraD family ATPase VirD4